MRGGEGGQGGTPFLGVVGHHLLGIRHSRPLAGLRLATDLGRHLAMAQPVAGEVAQGTRQVGTESATFRIVALAQDILPDPPLITTLRQRFLQLAEELLHHILGLVASEAEALHHQFQAWIQIVIGETHGLGGTGIGALQGHAGARAGFVPGARTPIVAVGMNEIEAAGRLAHPVDGCHPQPARRLIGVCRHAAASGIEQGEIVLRHAQALIRRQAAPLGGGSGIHRHPGHSLGAQQAVTELGRRHARSGGGEHQGGAPTTGFLVGRLQQTAAQAIAGARMAGRDESVQGALIARLEAALGFGIGRIISVAHGRPRMRRPRRSGKGHFRSPPVAIVRATRRPLMRLTDIPVMLGDVLVPRSLARRPEPTLTMEAAAQVEAYTISTAVSGAMAGAYCWQAGRISQAIAGRQRVLDLGCASGVQLAWTADLNPGVRFTGIDLSDGMLEQAHATIRRHHLGNVEVQRANMAALPFPDASFDAVVSTMACHHLPDAATLRATLAEVARVLVPGGALYIADLLRPGNERAVRYLSRRGNERAPQIFIDDYAHSLRASFTADEWRQAAAGPLPTAHVSAMRPWPVLGALHTRIGALPAHARAGLHRLRAGLDASARETLFDLRMGFWGSAPDPFRGLSRDAAEPGSDRHTATRAA